MTTNELESMGGASVVTTLVCNTVAAAMLRAERIPNSLIPFACYAVGLVVLPMLSGWTPFNCVNGFLVGAAAVGLNQGARQIMDANRSTTPPPQNKP